MDDQGFKGYVYFVQPGNEPAVKVGATVEPLEKRLLNLQGANHKELRLIGAIDVKKLGVVEELNRLALSKLAKEKEAEFEALFSGVRIHGKWFHLTDEILGYIRKNSNV